MESAYHKVNPSYYKKGSLKNFRLPFYFAFNDSVTVIFFFSLKSVKLPF